MIVTLAGGVGAARFLSGLVQVVPASRCTAVVNVGDDLELHGLHISPDLDTVTYTLAGAIDHERGWGLAGETWQALAGLRRYGAVSWFNLGDRDLATHLYRTERERAGAPLSAVTAEIAASWGVSVRILPVSDDPIRTRVVLAEDAPSGAPAAGCGDRAGDEVDFQEYFVRLRHAVAVSSVRFAGIEAARPAPGVLEAIGEADTVVLAPSNPIVSLAPVLGVPGVEDALGARRSRTVAVSPIVGGRALKGPADRLMRELGHPPTVIGVARLYRHVASVLVIDHADASLAAEVEAEGVRCLVTDTVMSTPERAAQLASVTLGASS